jgi:hypothetical protein
VDGLLFHKNIPKQPLLGLMNIGLPNSLKQIRLNKYSRHLIHHFFHNFASSTTCFLFTLFVSSSSKDKFVYNMAHILVTFALYCYDQISTTSN